MRPGPASRLDPAEQQQSNSLEGMIIRDNTYLALLDYLRKIPVSFARRFPPSEPRRQATSSSRAACYVRRRLGGYLLTCLSRPQKVRLTCSCVLGHRLNRDRGRLLGRASEACLANSGTPDAPRSLLKGRERCSTTAMPGLEEIVEWLKRMPTNRRRCNSAAHSSRRANPTVADNIDAMMTLGTGAGNERAGVEMGAHTVSHPLLSYEEPASVEWN